MLRKQISFVGLAGILLGALAIAGCGSGTDSADNTVAAARVRSLACMLIWRA